MVYPTTVFNAAHRVSIVIPLIRKVDNFASGRRSRRQSLISGALSRGRLRRSPGTDAQKLWIRKNFELEMLKWFNAVRSLCTGHSTSLRHCAEQWFSSLFASCTLSPFVRMSKIFSTSKGVIQIEFIQFNILAL